MKSLPLKKSLEPAIVSFQVKWPEVAKMVKKVNPKLAHAINTLDVAKDYPLTLKKANYGAILANQNNHCNPAIVLSKSCELYFRYRERIMPYHIYKAGDLIFAETKLDAEQWFYQHALWECTAGCRSVFMLPGISALRPHQRLLDHYQIDVDKPQKLQDQWHTFVAIANSPIHHKPWQAEILEFSDEWFLHRHDPAWSGFYDCFAESLLSQTAVQRNKALIDTLFGVFQHERYYKLNLSHVEQVSHLLMMGLGGTLGFRPATEEMAPTANIQKAYQLIYRMKDYAPIIMGPGYFDLNATEPKPIYYSCNYQTSYLLSPRENEFKTLAREFQRIHWLLGKMQDLVLSKKFIVEESKLYQLFKHCDFRFYHHEFSAYKEFLNPEALAFDDLTLMQKWDGLKLHTHNGFLNGAVMLNLKNAS